MLNKTLRHFINLIRKDLRLLLTISFAIFVFVLFFQPFQLDRFDFNNRLLFIAGIAAIIFLLMALVQVAFRWIIPDYDDQTYEPLSYMAGFIILVTTTVAISFYLRYVGKVDITFFNVFKLVIICLFPPAVLRLSNLFNELNRQNEFLSQEKKTAHKKLKAYEEDYLNKSIEFSSEHQADKLNLHISEVILIKSADNYVEIIYREGLDFRKKLLRSTMKNIELQLKPFPNFIRCHRTCIVNSYLIDKLHRKNNQHWLTIKDWNEQIPVSRQYLLKLKELI